MRDGSDNGRPVCLSIVDLSGIKVFLFCFKFDFNLYNADAITGNLTSRW